MDNQDSTAENFSNTEFCICCLSSGRLRSIFVPCKWLGENEIYSDMLSKSFCIDFSDMEGEGFDGAKFICEVCVVRLRDAWGFRRQVAAAWDYLKSRKGETSLKVECEFLNGTSNDNPVSWIWDDQSELEGSVNNDEEFCEPLMCADEYVNESVSIAIEKEIDIAKENRKSLCNEKDAGAKKRKKRRKVIATMEDLESRDVFPMRFYVNRTRCGICDLNLTSMDVIKGHMSAHDAVTVRSVFRTIRRSSKIRYNADNSTFQCKKCVRAISCLEEIRMHRQCRHPDLPLEDGTKGLRYTKDEVTVVFPIKVLKHGLRCNVCHLRILSMKMFMEHVGFHDEDTIKVHTKRWKPPRLLIVDDRVLCKKCHMTITDVDKMREHLKRTHHRRDYTEEPMRYALPFELKQTDRDCTICGDKFSSYPALNKHMNVHFPKYICEVCGLTFAVEHRLVSHLGIHRAPGHYPCEYCGKVFKKLRYRTYHINSIHKRMPRVLCSHCHEGFTSSFKLNQHLAEAHNEELKKYQCQYCPLKYITHTNLSIHIRRCHLKERNQVCGACGVAFFERKCLERHMLVHNEVSMFQCDVCTKSFLREASLARHKIVHTKAKSTMSCSVCGIEFVQKAALVTHLKTHVNVLR